MITRERILTVAPDAEPYVNQLVTQMQRDRIDANDRRGACFLGQIHVESLGFRKLTESLNYHEKTLLTLFSRERISTMDAKRYGRNSDHPADQHRLANILYGGRFGQRELGNIDPDDGWRYRGRGLKQLTGRDNYTRFSQWWCGDDRVVRDPDLLLQPHGAVASAIWFWNDADRREGINEYADDLNVQAVTRIVNGGENGLEDRKRWTNRYLEAFQRP